MDLREQIAKRVWEFQGRPPSPATPSWFTKNLLALAQDIIDLAARDSIAWRNSSTEVTA